MHSRTLLKLALLAVLALLAAPAVAANSCHGELWGGLWITDWQIDVANDTIYNPDMCGIGCLDNFRGRCGVISHWVCDRNPQSAQIRFASSRWCTEYDITQAIMACTRQEQNIPCSVTYIN